MRGRLRFQAEYWANWTAALLACVTIFSQVAALPLRRSEAQASGLRLPPDKNPTANPGHNPGESFEDSHEWDELIVDSPPTRT